MGQGGYVGGNGKWIGIARAKRGGNEMSRVTSFRVVFLKERLKDGIMAYRSF